MTWAPLLALRAQQEEWPALSSGLGGPLAPGRNRWYFTGVAALGQRGRRFCGIQAVPGTPCHQSPAQHGVWALHITPHLKHLVDSFSCLCRCLEVKEAPALCPEPPLAFVHAAVLRAVNLEQEKRQGSELGQGLQQEEQRSNSGKSGWRGCVYAEGMEAAWKGSTENAMKRPLRVYLAQRQ